MKKVISIVAFLLGSWSFSDDLVLKHPVYGVVKPAIMSNSLGINHGMVHKIHVDVGQVVRPGQSLVEVLEKETIRSYRSSIAGKVAKLHISQGAIISPGLPIVTVMDPSKKKLEISLSPNEAKKIRVGQRILFRGKQNEFGRVAKISPLVDPDSGAVLAYAVPKGTVKNLIGDVIPLDIVSETLTNCEVIGLNEVDKYSADYEVRGVAGEKACIKKK